MSFGSAVVCCRCGRVSHRDTPPPSGQSAAWYVPSHGICPACRALYEAGVDLTPRMVLYSDHLGEQIAWAVRAARRGERIETTGDLRRLLQVAGSQPKPRLLVVGRGMPGADEVAAWARGEGIRVLVEGGRDGERAEDAGGGGARQPEAARPQGRWSAAGPVGLAAGLEGAGRV